MIFEGAILGKKQRPHYLIFTVAKNYELTFTVVPPAENGAVFVTTNVVITPNQTQGKCPEDKTIKK